MELIWSRAHSVNIKELDEQHKRVVALINQLFKSMQSEEKTRNEAIKNDLEELFKLAEEHFRAEEQLFEKYNYPETLSHKQKHAELFQQVKTLLDRLEGDNYLSSQNNSTILRLLSLMQEWLIDHLLNIDKKYTAFLNERGVF